MFKNLLLKNFSYCVLVLAGTLFLSSCSQFKRLDNYLQSLPAVKPVSVGQPVGRNVVQKMNVRIAPVRKIRSKSKKRCLYIVRDLSIRNATKVWCRPK